MRTLRSSVTICGAAVLLAAAMGCAAHHAARLAPPEPVAIAFSRLAVVEFYDRTPYTGTGEKFTEALREKLAERTTTSDVVIVPRSALHGDDPFTTGRIPVNDLVRLRRQYMADAVVLGCVDSHNPYRPLSVHLSMKVIDTATGTVRFELADGWDAGSQRVRAEIEDYYARNYGKDDCRWGPDVFLISPLYYFRFVADRVAGGMTEKLVASL